MCCPLEVNPEPRHDQTSLTVAGVRVDAIQMQEAIERIEQWIREPRRGHYVAVTGMHGIAEAKKNASFRYALYRANMVVPDGMPLIWLARRRGLRLRKRVCGADLMEAFCRETGSRYHHFFYGGAPGVAQDLARTLNGQTGITVAGTYTPPFRPLDEREERELARQVEEAAPDILWVGLSTPKQERWMLEHSAGLPVPVMVGVGAAFDMLSGRTRRAPQWMQRSGLEWCHRLYGDPRRLWKRYLVTIPNAAWSLILEELRFKQSE